MTVQAPATVRPFTDRLTVTFGQEVEPVITTALRRFLGEHGFAAGKERGVWREPAGGTVHTSSRHQVFRVELSGAALASIRAVGGFLELLSLLGSEPHNVSRLDAALDVQVDPADVLRDLYRRGHEEGVWLTRKRASVRLHGIRRRESDGRDTGTCYVGRRHSRIQACVYDKVEERRDRGGVVPEGPLTRYELRGQMSALRLSLRDAWDPEAFFWHHMAPHVILPPPGRETEWTGMGEGFEVVRFPERDPMEQLLRRIDRSQELSELVRQAAEVPGGVEALKLRIGAIAKSLRESGGDVASSHSVATREA